MKEITVQGYKVTVEKNEGAYIVSVPELPGCTIQVGNEQDAARRIEGVIGDYLIELARRKPMQGAAGKRKKPGPTEAAVKLRR